MNIEAGWLKRKIHNALISALFGLGFTFIVFLCIYPNGWSSHNYLIYGLGVIIGALIRQRLPANTLSFTMQREPPKITEGALNNLLKPFQKQIPWYYYGGAYSGLFLGFWIVTQLTMKAQFRNGISMNAISIFLVGLAPSVFTYSVMFFVFVLRSWEKIAKRIT